MSLVGAGYNHSCALSVPSDAQYRKESKTFAFVSNPTPIPVDVSSIACISTGSYHTVLVTKSGNVLAAGTDKDFRIGSDNRKIYQEFTEIRITKEKVIWAACGIHFTLYLTSSGRVLMCHSKYPDERIQIDIPLRAVGVFAGQHSAGAIDEEGAVFIIDVDFQPKEPPLRFELPSPAVDLVCCKDFALVLCADGLAYGNGSLNHKSYAFAPIGGIGKVKQISGYCNSAIILTRDGKPLVFGGNSYGQLGNGAQAHNFKQFEPVPGFENKPVKTVCMYNHCFLLTEENELWGFGSNQCYQLFTKSDTNNVLSPVQIYFDQQVSQIFCGNKHTLILCYAPPLVCPSLQTNHQMILNLRSTVTELFDKVEWLRNENEIMRNDAAKKEAEYQERLNKIEEKVQLLLGNQQLIPQ